MAHKRWDRTGFSIGSRIADPGHTGRMRFGVGLDGRLGLSFDELRHAGREAARLGFESLWTPAGGVPDAFHVCAAWTHDTSLRTGISVVPAARMWTPVA